MARERNKNSDENLRGHVRQLRAENKNLKRQISRLEKQLARLPLEDLDEPEEETSPLHDVAPEYLCPKCRKEMVLLDLGIKTILSCTCGYRKSLTK
jgi:cell division protein FtsB